MALKTGIKSLDRLGGLPENSLIEICGKAGSGKTFFLHQFLVYFLLHNPRSNAIFFDVDMSFRPELIQRILKRLGKNSLIEDILRRITIVSAPESVNRIINILERKRGDYEVILIDSISSLFREPIDEIGFKEYMSQIISLGIELRKNLHFSTVLVSNQMRSIVKLSVVDVPLFDGLWYIEEAIPALGKVWEYFIDLRLYIKKVKRDMGIIITVFSNSIPETFSSFKYSHDFME